MRYSRKKGEIKTNQPVMSAGAGWIRCKNDAPAITGRDKTMSISEHKWFICKTGEKICNEQCILFINAPVDLTLIKKCILHHNAEWREATKKEIQYAKTNGKVWKQ
jgi:hypothetical protein